MKISKIYLYDEQSVPEIKISKLADFIKKTFSIDTEIRKNIFQNADKTLARHLASCRIINTKKPFEFHSPSIEEIEFENESFENSSKIKNIVMYDGFEFQKLVSSLISEDENSLDNFNIIFTNRLTCTYDYNDYRYHGHAEVEKLSRVARIEVQVKQRSVVGRVHLREGIGGGIDRLQQVEVLLGQERASGAPVQRDLVSVMGREQRREHAVRDRWIVHLDLGMSQVDPICGHRLRP